LLELIAASPGSVTLSDLASASELPTPTVHRLVQTLLTCGMVRQAADRRYTLGPRLIALGEAATAVLGSTAQPFLDELRDSVGETANLAALDQSEVVYLAQAPSRHMVRMFTEVGRRVHAYCTAVGKAMLACLPDDEVRRIVRASGMPRHTPTTITTPDELLAELERVRRCGYAIDEGEQELGVRCFAVVVTQHPSMTALSVSGPAGRLTDEMLERVLPALQDVATRLRSALTEAPPEPAPDAAHGKRNRRR
jgi:IclR family acetate operon transcriptional repressor